MYESLRQLIRHSQAGEADAVFAAMDLAFAIDLCKEEGAGQVKDRAANVDRNTQCRQIHSLHFCHILESLYSEIQNVNNMMLIP